MAYDVRQWPQTVYPDEVRKHCPEAEPVIDALIRRMQSHGPSPSPYAVKTLGKAVGGLWQVNLRVDGRQVRILYAPYGQMIVLFHIHKKSSKQEQNRAYKVATDRKKEYESIRSGKGSENGRAFTLH